MAGQMTVVLRSDPAPFEEGTDAAIKAIRDWETQTGVSADNASEKLEDAIRAVVDLGKQTDRSGDDIERALRGLGLNAEQAEDAVAAIEDETSKLGRQAPVDIERGEKALDDLGESAEDAGDKTGSIKDKTGEVGDGLRDLGQVVDDVLRGDFGSAASGAIEALGGLAGALTGGVVGGAIASAVSGIVGGWVESWNAAAQESEERISSWADVFIENQGRVVTEAQILERAQKILKEDTEKQALAMEVAAATGLSYAATVRALAGDTDYLTEAQTRLDEKVTESRDRVAELREEYGNRVPPNVLLARDALIELQASLAAQSSEMDAGAQVQKEYAEVARLAKDETDALTESMNNVSQEVSTTIKVNVDDSAAWAKIARLTSPKSVDMRVKPNGVYEWQ